MLKDPTRKQTTKRSAQKTFLTRNLLEFGDAGLFYLSNLNKIIAVTNKLTICVGYFLQFTTDLICHFTKTCNNYYINNLSSISHMYI